MTRERRDLLKRAEHHGLIRRHLTHEHPDAFWSYYEQMWLEKDASLLKRVNEYEKEQTRIREAEVGHVPDLLKERAERAALREKLDELSSHPQMLRCGRCKGTRTSIVKPFGVETVQCWDCGHWGSIQLKRLTPEDLRALEYLIVVKTPEDDDDEYADETNRRLKLLIAEVKLLGGPVCIGCQKNKARYSTDLCAICDMNLPEGERGERL